MVERREMMDGELVMPDLDQGLSLGEGFGKGKRAGMLQGMTDRHGWYMRGLRQELAI